MALTAVGVDRPGIVAALTGVLVDQGCNLEDSTMSMLRGHFVVLLVIDVPDGVEAEVVEAALRPVADALNLVVAVQPMSDDPRHGNDRSPLEQSTDQASLDPQAEGSVFVLSVHGADKPGIVHRAAETLAEAGGTVVDLSSRLVGTEGTPVYVMTLTVGFAPEVDAPAAVAAVVEAVEAFGVQCHAHRGEVDVL